MPMLCIWSSTLILLPQVTFTPFLSLCSHPPSFFPCPIFLSIFLSPGPKESSLTLPRVNANTRPCTTGRKVLGRRGLRTYLLSSAFNPSSPPGRSAFEQMQSRSALSSVCGTALDLLTHRSGRAALRKQGS